VEIIRRITHQGPMILPAQTKIPISNAGTKRADEIPQLARKLGWFRRFY